MEGMEEVVSVLVGQWGEGVVDMRNRAGGTALMEACKRGWVGVVKLLLHHTASPTLTDTLGNTPLHHASAYGHLSVIRVLLEAGAPADRVNRQGWTPISYSYSFEAEQCFQQLVAEMESQRARARAATPVFGRSERVVAGRQRARSGS
ncbi:ankyrin [Ascodesmis nigricans]|uniref:Ankyrin n=1 Tax=Ascodesmis nigricans TaxID=341454 RepID=A0A4S2N559_9PEZI|nr:ankyrin [Ascodesmis nigricans]